jgi:hypothetical protein
MAKRRLTDAQRAKMKPHILRRVRSGKGIRSLVDPMLETVAVSRGGHWPALAQKPPR